MRDYWPRPRGTVEDYQPLPGGMRPVNRAPSRPVISVSRVLSRVVVTLRGALDASAAPRLRPLLWDLIDGQGNFDVVIDLRDVDLIDPAGIGLLRGTCERMHRHGGRIEFRGTHVGVRASSGHSDLAVQHRHQDRHQEGEVRP